MRVIITNDRLDQRPGSDLYVRDLARALQKLGHFVVAYGSDPRQQPRLLELDSISVATDLVHLPFKPDIIHARHHLDAMTAALALPGVPVIHHVTERSLRLPLPTHPRIFRYIAPSTRAARWMGGQEGLAGGAIDIVADGVDLLRFSAVRVPSPTPMRVLIYDDEIEPDCASVHAIRRATDVLGMKLQLLGRRLGRAVDNPEALLPEYDIVCARSVKALEALCSGCAVLPISGSRCGTLTDEDNFDRAREAGFDLDEADGRPVSAELVAEAFSAVSPSSCLSLAARARRESGFDDHAVRIEVAYRAAVESGAAHTVDGPAEQRAVSQYLDRVARMIKNVDQIRKSEGDVPLSTASKFVDVSARLAAIQTDLDKPQW